MTLEDLLPVGMVAGPLVAGACLRVGLRAAWASVAIGVLAAALVVLSLRVPALNPADVLLSALLAGVGVWVTGQATTRRRLASLAAVGLFVGTAEIAARTATMPVPGTPAPVAVDLENLSSFCTAAATHQKSPLPTDGHYVLHLGDSMIAWAPGDTALAITRLNTLDSHVHVQAGIVGTGPDCALLVMRDLPAADLVVLHLFALNDLADLDSGYAWCAGGPLFDYRTDPPTPRCPEGPNGALNVVGRVMATPAPWLLRWARSTSAAAVLLTDAWETVRYQWSTLPSTGTSDQTADRLAKLASILTLIQGEVRAHGGTFVVSLVPLRRSWLNDEVQQRLVRLRATLDQTGVPWIDATRLLADAEDAGVSPDLIYSQDRPEDPHLAEQGQQRYAAWLTEHLAPWLAGVPPRAP